jgi:PhnB protein
MNARRSPEEAMQFTPYLYFKGACEAALEFYAECGLGSIRELRRYEGTPMAGRDGGAWRNKVLHSQFEGPRLRLYASDGPDSEPMKGCALLIESESVDDAEQLFERMSAEGRVTVPFKRQFWGDTYGNSPTSSACNGRSSVAPKLESRRSRSWTSPKTSVV